MSIHHWPELLTGFATGVALTTVIQAFINRASGKLLIDRTDPELDVYRFDIDREILDKIHTKKRIVLIVDPNADLSQGDVSHD